MKVLFIVPPQKTLLGDETNIVGDPHLGIGYLSTMLRKHNIETSVVDMRLGFGINYLLEQIERYNPNLIGITSYSLGYKSTYEIIGAVKSKGDWPIVIGGPHVSVARDEVLKETDVDFAVLREGEYTLLELCQSIEQGASNFESIKGLIWRRNGIIVTNPERPINKELDKLPFPDFNDVDLKKYQSYMNGSVQISTSRGCPYACNYCSVALAIGRGFRARSPENVVDEIEYWYKKGIKGFKIVDDCFTLDKNRVTKICDLILEKGMKIRWNLYNGIRVDMVDKKLLQKMADAGCIYAAFGVESGNDQILKTIGKNITVKQVREAFRLASEVGIMTAAFFIIGHPGETYETAMETLKLAEELPASYVNFFNLVPYPGTSLFEWVKQNGKFIYPPKVYLNSLSLKQEDPVFETKEFTAQERRKAIMAGFSLYRKTQLKLKLGPILGELAYKITSFHFLEEMLWKLALATKLGYWTTHHVNKLTNLRLRRQRLKKQAALTRFK